MYCPMKIPFKRLDSFLGQSLSANDACSLNSRGGYMAELGWLRPKMCLSLFSSCFQQGRCVEPGLAVRLYFFMCWKISYGLGPYISTPPPGDSGPYSPCWRALLLVPTALPGHFLRNTSQNIYHLHLEIKHHLKQQIPPAHWMKCSKIHQNRGIRNLDQ